MTNQDHLLQELEIVGLRIQNLKRQELTLQARRRAVFASQVALEARQAALQEQLALLEEQEVEEQKDESADELREQPDSEVEYVQGKKKGTGEGHLH